MLDANGRATVEVAARHQSTSIVVDWPASPPVDETFQLFFTLRPAARAGFSANSTNPVFRSYLQNSPRRRTRASPQCTPPAQAAPPGGADALKDWLDNRLARRSR